MFISEGVGGSDLAARLAGVDNMALAHSLTNCGLPVSSVLESHLSPGSPPVLFVHPFRILQLPRGRPLNQVKKKKKKRQQEGKEK